MWITRLSCRCVNLTRLDLSNTQMTSEGLAMFVSPSKHKLKLHGSLQVLNCLTARNFLLGQVLGCLTSMG